jgi:acetylxylan esterase
MSPSPLVALGGAAAIDAGVKISTNSRQATGPAACAAGVHMIVARASTEDPGTGIIGAVANGIAAQIPGSDIVAVDYPAVLNPYLESETAGAQAMTKLVTDYAAQCPKTKMVLMGYSQVR